MHFKGILIRILLLGKNVLFSLVQTEVCVCTSKSVQQKMSTHIEARRVHIYIYIYYCHRKQGR